jgi:hypothetical protein
MYLLYVDESGSVPDPHQYFFVLAGVSLFERQTFWLNRELTAIASRFDNAHPELVELQFPSFQPNFRLCRQEISYGVKRPDEPCVRTIGQSLRLLFEQTIQ